MRPFGSFLTIGIQMASRYPGGCDNANVCWRSVETLALQHHTSLYGPRRHQGDSSAQPVRLLTGWTRHDLAGVWVEGRELVYTALSVGDVNTVMNGGAGY